MVSSSGASAGNAAKNSQKNSVACASNFVSSYFGQPRAAHVLNPTPAGISQKSIVASVDQPPDADRSSAPSAATANGPMFSVHMPSRLLPPGPPWTQSTSGLRSQSPSPTTSQ